MWLHKKVSVGNEMTTQGIECANVFPTRVAIRYRVVIEFINAGEGFTEMCV